MPEPAVFDFPCIRGTTPTFGLTINQIVAGVPEPATYTDLRLSVKAGAVTFQAKLSEPGPEITETSPGVFTIFFPAAWTRAMGVGLKADGTAKNQYEIEIWNGAYQMVYLRGDITASGGLNTDA